MNKIIIVEDRLKKGISLAEQFLDFSKEHPELKIDVPDVFYFKPDKDKALAEINEQQETRFKIEPISLWDFFEKMDDCLNKKDKNPVIIMDFLLEGDGSDGIAMRRVNIRYEKSLDDAQKGHIWFYTAIGQASRNILSQLINKNRILDPTKTTPESLRLDLNNESFLNSLRESALAGA